MATSFFDKFPKVKYDILNSKVNKQYEDVTNVFLRIAYLKEILSNATSYRVYEIDEGDTPDVLAQKVYEDAGAAWMIIYANQILDPQFEWPLDYQSFQNFIVDKYGSVANAKIGIHHYEKVITRTVNNGPEDIVTENKFIVNKGQETDGVLYLANTNGSFLIGEDVFYGNQFVTFANADFKGDVVAWDATNNIISVANTQGDMVFYNTLRGNTSLANGQIISTAFNDVPYDYYNNLPETQSVNVFELGGRTITEIIKRNAVSYYDYENQLNENRRTIKVIKKQYYGRIMSELDNITGYNAGVLRRVR